MNNNNRETGMESVRLMVQELREKVAALEDAVVLGVVPPRPKRRLWRRLWCWLTLGHIDPRVRTSVHAVCICVECGYETCEHRLKS